MLVFPPAHLNKFDPVEYVGGPMCGRKGLTMAEEGEVWVIPWQGRERIYQRIGDTMRFQGDQ